MIERMTNGEALSILAQSEPRACTEFPSFLGAPEMISADLVGEAGVLTFRCTDNANERAWRVGVAVDPAPPASRDEARDRIMHAAVLANEVADKIAKAVFN